MLDLRPTLVALAINALIAGVTWPVSVIKKDVSIVDTVWPLFFVLSAWSYAMTDPSVEIKGRSLLALALVTLWGLRLSAFITWRSWGHGEDARYRAIRERNEPGFGWKSLYLIFALQALLAWIIAMSVYAAIERGGRLGILDCVGITLWVIGFLFESIGDAQLASFKSDPANRERVLDTGLWRYTRHPNYFGEATAWWGIYVIAVAASAWWTLFAPVVITFLLLRVSGVTLQEKDIGERRPGYRDYIARTHAFFPWWPRFDR